MRNNITDRFDRIIRWFIRNRVHIALCSVAAAWAWARLAGFQPLAADLVTVPLVMLGIYQWNRLYDLKEDLINSPAHAQNTARTQNAIRFSSLFGFAAAFLLAYTGGEPAGLLYLLIVVLLGFFYSTPVLGCRQGKRLKNIPGVKNGISALGWSLLVVVYPAIHSGVSMGTGHWFAFGYMFAAVWAVELAWDLRDRRGDRLAGVHTVPLLLGGERSRRLMLAINLCSGAAVLFGVLWKVVPVLWFFVLSNNLLIYLWISRTGDRFWCDRRWSHLLVGGQILLLAALGVLAGNYEHQFIM